MYKRFSVLCAYSLRKSGLEKQQYCKKTSCPSKYKNYQGVTHYFLGVLHYITHYFAERVLILLFHYFREIVLAILLPLLSPWTLL